MSLVPTKNSITLRDAEFNSAINRAASEAGTVQFKWVLATLEQNLLNRIRLADTEKQEFTSLTGLGVTNFYPKIPLKADNHTWQSLEVTRGYINTGDITNAKLWQIMHPEALSLFNDAKKLDDQVVANTSYFTQNQQALIDRESKQHNVEQNQDNQSNSIDENIENTTETQMSLNNSMTLEQDPTMLFEILNQLSEPDNPAGQQEQTDLAA